MTETTRALASLRRVSSVVNHPNADRLDLVMIDGWQVISQRGKHTVGELVVYYEIDSVLPVSPVYEFLRKSCYIKKDWLEDGEGFRLRTIKLRKEISQGLVMSLEDLGLPEYTANMWYKVGETDLTSYLGIVKYDPPVPAQLAGVARGNFPDFIPKTDQDRVQNCYRKVLEEPDDWEVTVKLEGSSMTIYRGADGDWGVCSRNIDLKLGDGNPDNAFVKMFNELIKNTDLFFMHNNLAIQGELMGPKIQGNIEGFRDLKFFVYDIWDIKHQSYLKPAERVLLCHHLGLNHVPVIKREFELDEMLVSDLVQMSDGPSINAKLREGLVFKNNHTDASFKVISNQYLLGEK